MEAIARCIRLTKFRSANGRGAWYEPDERARASPHDSDCGTNSDLHLEQLARAKQFARVSERKRGRTRPCDKSYSG